MEERGTMYFQSALNLMCSFSDVKPMFIFTCIFVVNHYIWDRLQISLLILSEFKQI